MRGRRRLRRPERSPLQLRSQQSQAAGTGTCTSLRLCWKSARCAACMTPRKHPYAALLCNFVHILLVNAEPGQACSQATLIDSTYLLLEGVSATTPWLRASGAFTKAGVVDTSALLSPAFASLPDANASGSWLDGGADGALVAICCGGQRLVIPVRLSAPGYAPEVAIAAFNASVLQTWSNMTGKTAGGVVAGLFQERPGGGGSLEDLMLGGGVPADQANAASAPPELITRVPTRAALANATLFIDTTFAGPKWARQRTAASGGGQAEAGGTKAASVDLSGTGVNTAASTCSNPANPDCPNYDPKLDPACQALSPPPPARCNRTVNSAAGAREGATTQQTGIISGAGSAYSGGGTGGYGGYGYGGYGYGGCAAHVPHTCSPCQEMHLLVGMAMLLHRLQLVWVMGWCLRPSVSAQAAPVHACLGKSYSASLAMWFF